MAPFEAEAGMEPHCSAGGGARGYGGGESAFDEAACSGRAPPASLPGSGASSSGGAPPDRDRAVLRAQLADGLQALVFHREVRARGGGRAKARRARNRSQAHSSWCSHGGSHSDSYLPRSLRRAFTVLMPPPRHAGLCRGRRLARGGGAHRSGHRGARIRIRGALHPAEPDS